MKTLAVLLLLTLSAGCGDEDQTMVCETNVTCEDDKEMFCDDPVSTQFSDGTTL